MPTPNNTCIVHKDTPNLTCQFRGEHFTEKFFEHEGNSYCIFHLPTPNKNETIAQDEALTNEIRSLRRGKNKNNDFWYDYSYVIDEELYSIGSPQMPTKCDLVFTGSALSGGLTLHLERIEETNKISLDKIKTIGCIEIHANNLCSLIINDSIFGNSVTIDILDCRELLIKQTCFLSKTSFNNPKGEFKISSLIIHDCKFNTNTSFRILQINKCEISNTKFTGTVDFYKCSFAQSGSMLNCSFDASEGDSYCTFNDCSFNNKLEFTDVDFNVRTLFHSIYSPKRCSSNNLIFNDICAKNTFTLTVLNNSILTISNISFINTKKSYLSKCSFEMPKKGCENFSIENYRINNDIEFKTLLDSNDLPPMSFSNSAFEGNISLQDFNFTGKTNFTNCKFNKAPLFHRSNLHPDTIFPYKNAFKDRKLDAENAYQTLYTWAAELKKREYEGMFYALTQSCQRKGTPSWTKRFFSFAYDAISEYGMNYKRPLLFILLLALIIFPSVFYLKYNLSPLTAESLSFEQVLPYPILHMENSEIKQIIGCEGNTNSFYSTTLLADNGEITASIQEPLQSQHDIDTCKQMSSFKLWATSESISLSILFTIFILALRWNFKRD